MSGSCCSSGPTCGSTAGTSQSSVRRSMAGHLRVTVGANTTARFRLSTWTKVVLTTLQPGTEFIVCQDAGAPPDRARHLSPRDQGRGRVGGQGHVDGPRRGAERVQPERRSSLPWSMCVPSGDVDAWYQAALRQRTRRCPSAPSCATLRRAPSTAPPLRPSAPETTQGTGRQPRPPASPARLSHVHEPPTRRRPTPPQPTDTTPPQSTRHRPRTPRRPRTRRRLRTRRRCRWTRVRPRLPSAPIAACRDRCSVGCRSAHRYSAPATARTSGGRPRPGAGSVPLVPPEVVADGATAELDQRVQRQPDACRPVVARAREVLAVGL